MKGFRYASITISKLKIWNMASIVRYASVTRCIGIKGIGFVINAAIETEMRTYWQFKNFFL